MSSNVKNRIQELNNRLADTLVEKGIDASGQETTTELIEKVGQFQPGEIPDGYIKPEGSMDITENGTFDVREKAEVNVNTPPMQWQRPKDWLPYPEMSTEYDEIWMLIHVSKEYGAARMYQVGSYTVDWGDGEVENFENVYQVIPSSKKSNHFYNFETLDPQTETEFGYRQCWCRAYRERGSLNEFFIGWEYLNGSGLPEILTIVEVVINSGSSLVNAKIYSVPKLATLRHIKSIGNTVVRYGSFQGVKCLEYVEGNFKFQTKVANPIAGMRLPYNYIKFSFEELEITSGANCMSQAIVRGVELDCAGVNTLQTVCNGVKADEVIFKNTEKCSNFNGVLRGSQIIKCTGLTFENATDISNAYYANTIYNIDGYLKGLQGEKVLLATSTFYDNKIIQKCPDLIIPNCTNINTIFRSCEALFEVGTCDFSSITSATDAFFNVYYLKRISFVEESIPISLNFSKSTLLELESAKSIIKGLKNYVGTDKEFAYSIQFSAETLDLINADGATAPDGLTWREYAISKGWNI